MKAMIPAAFAAILSLATTCEAGLGDNMPFVRAFKEDLTPKWEGEQGAVNFLEDSNFDHFHGHKGSNGPSVGSPRCHAFPRVVGA